MASNVTRRDFLKTAGVSAGVMMAAGYSPFSYAANDKIHVAKIGCGGQGLFRHMRDGLRLTEDIDVVTVCDVYEPNLRRGQQTAEGMRNGEVPAYYDYRELLENENVDAFVISTSQDAHYQPTMDALDAGKYVFCEKTLTYDQDIAAGIQRSRDIVEKCHETGLFCQVGHQRRYNPQYLKAVWLARNERTLGRINYLRAQWHQNPRDAWRRPVDPGYEFNEYEAQFIDDLERHMNWRHYPERSGGLMTEFTAHQVDIWNWFLGTMPSRVWGSGGTDYWRDGREVVDNVALTYEYELRGTEPGFNEIPERTSELTENFHELARPYTVRGNYSCLLANAHGGIEEYIYGDLGTFELSERGNHLEGCYLLGEPDTQDIGEAQEAEQLDQEEGVDMEEVADAIAAGETLGLPPDAYRDPMPIRVVEERSPSHLQFEAFAKCIKEGGKPYNNEMVGHLTVVAVLKGLESVREETVVEIDPALYEFDFDTPDPYQYAYIADPEYADDNEEGLDI